jgi:hypothetical protein
MSHDITIRSDGSFSRSTAKQGLLDFLRAQPNLVPNGNTGFALDDRPKRWMEIDLDVVTEDGDSVEEPLDRHDEINCIRLHVPYAFLKSSTLNEGYLPLAFKIADFLKWEVYDEQLGEPYV